MLSVWWVSTLAWAASELPLVLAGEIHATWLLFFGVLAGASTLGPWVGWSQGGAWLDTHRGWWVEALEGEDVGEDW